MWGGAHFSARRLNSAFSFIVTTGVNGSCVRDFFAMNFSSDVSFTSLDSSSALIFSVSADDCSGTKSNSSSVGAKSLVFDQPG